jgi:hypothetical protein
MEKMTHAEYITSLRREAGRVAALVISGHLSLLDGCWALGPLLAQAELDPDDTDAHAIGLICSELDGLPLGANRGHWAPEALERLAPELDLAMEWATPIAMPAMQSVARRFGA